jgi:hypothetical protein
MSNVRNLVVDVLRSGTKNVAKSTSEARGKAGSMS